MMSLQPKKEEMPQAVLPVDLEVERSPVLHQ